MSRRYCEKFENENENDYEEDQNLYGYDDEEFEDAEYFVHSKDVLLSVEPKKKENWVDASYVPITAPWAGLSKKCVSMKDVISDLEENEKKKKVEFFPPSLIDQSSKNRLLDQRPSQDQRSRQDQDQRSRQDQRPSQDQRSLQDQRPSQDQRPRLLKQRPGVNMFDLLDDDNVKVVESYPIVQKFGKTEVIHNDPKRSAMSSKEFVSEHLKKTKFCKNIVERGHCGRRKDCNFAHSMDEFSFPECIYGYRCVKRDRGCQFLHLDENVDEYKKRIGFIIPKNIQ